MYHIYDRHLGLHMIIEAYHLKNTKFDLVSWYCKGVKARIEDVGGTCDSSSSCCSSDDDILIKHLFDREESAPSTDKEMGNYTSKLQTMELYGQQVPTGTYPSIQRNTAHVKDPAQKVPKPLVIVVKINGEPARVLIDSGSLGDFLSSMIAQQLQIKKKELTSPVLVQLAVQGSCSRINFGATARFQYQNISEDRYFDVINLSGYDLILGTP
ncbi:hypothetical protein C0992_003703 [Termitomyces sp. T32_za158]|nr:hypothetical protein C0992_003703 [Termitomyces sp. T32_za158]